MNITKKAILAGVVALCGGIIVTAGVLVLTAKVAYTDTPEVYGTPDTFAVYNEPTEVTTEITTKPAIEVLKGNQEVAELEDTAVIEIPELEIKAPIHEGIDDGTLAVAVGHFPGCGVLGEGNYSLAGHSSDFYDCIFNNLKDVELGMCIKLHSVEGEIYTYYVTENFVVDPEEVWVVDDFGDNRVTLVTCTDRGNRRQIVVGLLMTEDEYVDYATNLAITKKADIVNSCEQIKSLSVSDYFNSFVNPEITEVATETNKNATETTVK